MHLQDIQKLGVGISGDAHKLQRDFGVQCNGLVCLSEEASMRLRPEQMPANRGLAGTMAFHHHCLCPQQECGPYLEVLLPSSANI